jgi:predicted short-subunit dehydrogenase-like oxidoreductase (DUF2520 family)
VQTDPGNGPARGQSGAAPLQDVVLALVGAGRVGSSLARWAVAAGARLRAVTVHHRREAAEELARELAPPGRPAAVVAVDELDASACDLLLVAVSDPALDAVAAHLARRPLATVALHTAGSRGASALGPLADRGAAVGTLHPLKAFPHVLSDPAAAQGVTFAVDGDAPAVALAERLARAWGGVPRRVPESRRDLYHLAATLAAGGVVTLMAATERIAAAAGLAPEVVDGYLELARGALAAGGEERAAGGSFAGAVTGPAARGDVATVERQLAALRTVDAGLAGLATDLARETLRALAARGPLGRGQRELLSALGGDGEDDGEGEQRGVDGGDPGDALC